MCGVTWAELWSSGGDGIFSDSGSKSCEFFIALASITIATSYHHVLINRQQFLIGFWSNAQSNLGSCPGVMPLPSPVESMRNSIIGGLWLLGGTCHSFSGQTWWFLCLKPLINSLGISQAPSHLPGVALPSAYWAVPCIMATEDQCVLSTLQRLHTGKCRRWHH